MSSRFRFRRRYAWDAGGAPPEPFDPDAEALFARMTVQPSDARKIVINDCIVALKAAGVWPLLDVLWLLAAHDEQAALLNWKAATTTPVALNTVFAIDRGFTGDGISARIHTRYNPSAISGNYTQDDASLWVWCRTGSLNSVGDVGTITAPMAVVCVMNANGDISIGINDSAPNETGTASSIGFSGASRSDASFKRAWRNGVQLGADMLTTSNGVPDTEQWICGANPSSFSTRQIAAAAWGASLAGKELAFYTAILNYMTAVGAMADEAVPLDGVIDA
jgi:hypothetical protein